MIDESRTLEICGYTSNELTYGSNKLVVAVCEDCGLHRDITFRRYHDLCQPCSCKGRQYSEEGRRRISKGQLGRHHTEETKKKMSDANKGRRRTEEHRRRQSAVNQGIPYEEWESFAKDQKYCPMFNEVCRESNREKYDRKCFICGLPESENVDRNGKQRKLSVHHVDLNKSQGCDDVRWKLVPVCMEHHNHSELWGARIGYLLSCVWVEYALGEKAKKYGEV